MRGLYVLNNLVLEVTLDADVEGGDVFPLLGTRRSMWDLFREILLERDEPIYNILLEKFLDVQEQSWVRFIWRSCFDVWFFGMGSCF